MISKKLLKYIPLIALGLIVLSAGLILYFILRYGVDFPYMDQWEYVGFFDHLSKGTLTFHELFKLQGEYRQLFPNIIYVSLGWLTHWNVKYEMIVTFFLACLVSFNIYRLVSYTIAGENWLKWVLFFVANLFIFSPIQYENWLFGVQIEYFMPIACITTAMAIAFSNVKVSRKLFLCILLSTISTYSSVNGFLCWIVLLPVYYFSGTDRAFFKKWKVINIWLLGAATALAFYLIGYKKPDKFPSTSIAFSHPADALRYFLGALGNPARIVHSLNHIIVVGGVLVSVFMALTMFIVWNSRRNKHLLQVSVVWIMLGMFSVMTAAMITVGRLGFGVYQSLASRYTSFTLYLVVSTIFLSAIVIQHLAKGLRINILLKTVFTLLIAYIIYIKVDTYPNAITDLKNFHTNIEHGKAGLLLINHVFPAEYENKIYPGNFTELQRRARVLDTLGYLRPKLVKKGPIQKFEGQGSGTIDYGSFNKLTKINDTSYTASGFAMNPETKEPADAVLLSYENMFGKSYVYTLENTDSLNWKIKFSIVFMPYDPIILRAWAFDGNTGKAYRLKGEYIINRQYKEQTVLY